MGALTYAYLGTSVLLKRPELLERYGSFLSFIVVGMAYNYVIYASIAAPGGAINPWNLMWNLLVPANLLEVVLGSVLFRYILGIAQFLIYMLVATAFGVKFNVNIPSTVAAFALGTLIMWSLGMVSAGVQVVTKRWDPVTWFFTMLGSLLSGVWFPYQLLPPYLQALSRVMPQTYILEMLRAAMLRGEPLTDLVELLTPLLATATLLFAIGSLVYVKSIEYTKERGIVGEY